MCRMVAARWTTIKTHPEKVGMRSVPILHGLNWCLAFERRLRELMVYKATQRSTVCSRSAPEWRRCVPSTSPMRLLKRSTIPLVLGVLGSFNWYSIQKVRAQPVKLQGVEVAHAAKAQAAIQPGARDCLADKTSCLTADKLSSGVGKERCKRSCAGQSA